MLCLTALHKFNRKITHLRMLRIYTFKCVLVIATNECSVLWTADCLREAVAYFKMIVVGI